MISPYVRRLRLAAELRALRTRAGLTHEQLAKKIGASRAQISRLENSHVPPDQDDIITILDALGVEGEQWTQLLTIAREAAERGWWESNKAMGARQPLFANLEAGATSICEYQQTFFPGLMQTAEFTRVRVAADWFHRPVGVGGEAAMNADGIVKGRAGRQRMLARPGGPMYEVIVDEVVLLRRLAPPAVLRAQLLHMVDKARTEKITVRVLPVEADIEGYAFAPSTFSIYRYADPGDPVVVGVEAVTSDVVLTGDEQVMPYLQMYDRIRAAALPEPDSLHMIAQAADRLADI
ncbi:helix-turn-helix transcriptional regulator [Spongiactinospora sp. TRM90649]|uniref:helix-turn-helix domain-containing protein n=1 Tax=Spongiactinospora sp. TRM90649 TaxID=3031114 RepID=UPI0023F8374A|nr:helix-turn-helix transcriptional regulator [Spongiactinospora sp. TRM90649]MDF5758387.1 helix-turn-helix transcriptional regulator [Spongiactinospora sp. TRM90649]